MLLAIDVGNTNSVFALFEGEQVSGIWRISTNAKRTADEYAVFLLTLMREHGFQASMVKTCIVGSVVPDANFNITKLCCDYFATEPLFVGSKSVKTGLKLLLDRPEEIGADRIINAVGGLARYKPPFVIIDFGTATTFDVVNAAGDYAGGVIAPGINLSLQALHMAAAKLPLIAIVPPSKAIGTNTIDAMRSGIYWGYVGLIEGMLDRIQNELGSKPEVIATGGLAPLFAEATKLIDQLDNELTLRGLNKIYQLNN